MPTVRVRISSDAAGAISLTPVVVQEMDIRELVDHMVSVCGKDFERVSELMRRGSMVSGGSRLRWEGWQPEHNEVETLLASFPDPDPRRPFAAERCVLAVLCGGIHQVRIPREAAEKRRFLRRHSFWEYVVALGAGAQYADYSYRERADVYRAKIGAAAQNALAEASELLTYSSLAQQLNQFPVEAVDLYVVR
jgi:hypothetical protein